MELSTLKSLAIGAIIFGCFAIIYPRLFHPLLFGGSQTKRNDHTSNQLPPHLRQPGGGKPSVDDISRHMKASPHGPHPGMRAMGEMRKQASETRGSGRGGGGVMSMIMPVYAVGIVIYMGYTLYKVFTRKKDPKGNARGSRAMTGGFDNNGLSDKFTTSKRGRKEQLSAGRGNDDVDDNQISTLKKRLRDTELQMAALLKAMEKVEKKTTSAVADEAGDARFLADELRDAERLEEDDDELTGDRVGILHSQKTKSARAKLNENNVPGGQYKSSVRFSGNLDDGLDDDLDIREAAEASDEELAGSQSEGVEYDDDEAMNDQRDEVADSVVRQRKAAVPSKTSHT